MRILLNLGLTLATSAIALLIAAAVLDGFNITEWLFPVVVVVYTGISILVRVPMRWVFRRWAARASALVGLAVTFVTLLVTDVLADSLTIEGSTAWVVGTLIVWVAWLLTDWIITGARVRRAQRATGPGRV